jgi:xanthine/uracil permease
MNFSNPIFWAVAGFFVGFVVASGGTVSNPIDSLLGGLLQAGIWYLVSKLILKRKKKS